MKYHCFHVRPSLSKVGTVRGPSHCSSKARARCASGATQWSDAGETSIAKDRFSGLSAAPWWCPAPRVRPGAGNLAGAAVQAVPRS
ncbi:hypothetical protein MYA_5252 [Burkholderia sp. KJ006]|nr:hypothetical protein MYA_5252 [Burkholderia sp. KJ006]